MLRQAQLVKSLFELQREFILISTGYDLNESPTRSGRHYTNPMGSGPAQAGKMREIKTFAARHAYRLLICPHFPYESVTRPTCVYSIQGRLKTFYLAETRFRFWPLSQPILVQFKKLFSLLKAYEKGFQKQAKTVVSVLQAPLDS